MLQNSRGVRGQARAQLPPGIPTRSPLLSGSSPSSQKPPFQWPAIGNKQLSHRQPPSEGHWVHGVFGCESPLPQQRETGRHWDSDSNRGRHCSMPGSQRRWTRWHRAPNLLCSSHCGALPLEGEGGWVAVSLLWSVMLRHCTGARWALCSSEGGRIS